MTLSEHLHGDVRAIVIGQEDFASPHEILVRVVPGPHLRDREVEDFGIQPSTVTHQEPSEPPKRCDLSEESAARSRLAPRPAGWRSSNRRSSAMARPGSWRPCSNRSISARPTRRSSRAERGEAVRRLPSSAAAISGWLNGPAKSAARLTSPPLAPAGFGPARHRTQPLPPDAPELPVFRSRNSLRLLAPARHR